MKNSLNFVNTCLRGVDTRRIALSFRDAPLEAFRLSSLQKKGLVHRGAQAFIAFAAGAKSWGNGVLRERLENAVRNAKGPVFVLQANNDFSVGPTNVLGKIAKTNGGQAEIYPAFGNNSQDGHWGFATTNSGIEVWQKDVLDFINSAFVKPLKP
jgi:hypothetical protein